MLRFVHKRFVFKWENLFHYRASSGVALEFELLEERAPVLATMTMETRGR